MTSQPYPNDPLQPTREERQPATVAENTLSDNRPRSRAVPADWPAIPRYEVLGELGHGGMGIVYKVRDRRLDRVVALKVLRSGALADAAEIQRFRREARAMARLHHPHIVNVHDHGEFKGQPYLTMEFVPGGSLSQHLKRIGADVQRSAALMESVSRAVHYLHQNKVLHRDLKPHNILLDENDVPRVGDFGLAKFLDPGQEMTQLGLALGTLPYMAPEQISLQASSNGFTAEVWPLGVIFYELLTSRRPFDAPDREALARQIVTQTPPPPRSLRPDLDPALEAVILKCLQKDQAARYPSAGALAEDLGRLRRGEGRVEPSEPTLRLSGSRRRRLRAAVPVALCLSAILALFVGVLRPGENKTVPVEPPPIVLIGAKGGPQKFEWLLGEKDAVVNTEVDGTFTIRTRKVALLQLWTAPAGASYHLEAEVSNGNEAGGSAGLFFGHERFRIPPKVGHQFGVVSTAEQPGPRPPVGEQPPGRAYLYVGYCTEPAPADISRHYLSRALVFPAAVPGAHVWRKLEAEVSPQSLEALWTGRSVAKISDAEFPQIAQTTQALRGDPWHVAAGGGLGIFVESGTASFKQVVVRKRNQ
jgi:tRNA A-37 threonylcarbamoyl transferase component Bud32